ncbi:hypothetical protein [Luteimonas sp. SDU101]|uniref:hypothetical protein n=1 Tax=unclassified Luteimonas TaxID=2629088 RepID=UPI003EB847E3
MLPSSVQSTVVVGPWQASAPSAPPPRSTPERRKPAVAPTPEALRAGLTAPQLVTLEALEIFRWRLGFVRRPLFQAPIPVVFDQDGSRFVVILEDGTLDETPALKLRS